jgi:NAD(P)H-dependent FMN reductase
VRILAISGSLDDSSANTALLREMRTAATGHDLVLFDAVDELPYFRPDRDGDPAPPAVAELRVALGGADAAVIATPEYAGGMPGSLKNALDWVVSSGELYGKPVVVVSAAPSDDRGQGARDWVERTLRMQGAAVRDSFSVGVSRRDPESVRAAADGVLRRTLAALSAPAASRSGE